MLENNIGVHTFLYELRCSIVMYIKKQIETWVITFRHQKSYIIMLTFVDMPFLLW